MSLQWLKLNALFVALVALSLANVAAFIPQILDCVTNRGDQVMKFEERLQSAKPDVSKYKTLQFYYCTDNIQSDMKHKAEVKLNVMTSLRDFFTCEYVLCPTILLFAPQPDKSAPCLCLGTPAQVRAFCDANSFRVAKDYGSDVYLLNSNE